MAFNFNSGQTIDDKTEKKAGFNFDSGKTVEMDSASYKKAGNDMLDLSKKTLDPVKQKTYLNLSQQYFDKAGSSIQNTMSQGLGSKIIERGKNIVSEFKPQKPEETSAYQKVSNALGGKSLRVFGQMAGAVGDVAGTVIGKGVKKIYETAYSPEKRDEIKQTVSNILETPIGQAGMNAIKGGIEIYQDWKKSNPNAAKDLEAVVNVASLLPIGKGVKATGEVVAGATTGVRKSVAKTIIGSAEKNVSQALAPTTKEAKYLTTKITPKFIEKGIIGSRETILKKAEAGAEEFKNKIQSYISSGKLKGEVPKEKVISAIDEFSKSGITKGGVVIDTEKVELAEKMRGIVSKLEDVIPAEEAKSVLRILGRMTERKKGFTTGGGKIISPIRKRYLRNIGKRISER